ncbi:hypothetical protein EWM64_g6499 [Hericium alpestre]|uniref:Uncharacterized protein n=1 Tax=Hericium alpestre TaxID=135208 RepID=A0A4Y9ZRV0_9AGAM|nr:hypothetical protein EWM64_g6499 [Hericium alpestre]
MDSTNASDAPQEGRVPSGDKSQLQQSAELEADARYRDEQPSTLNSAVGVVKDTAAKMMPGGFNGGEDKEGISEFRSTDSTPGSVQDKSVDQPNSDGAAGQEPSAGDNESSEIPLGEGPLEVAGLRNSETGKPEEDRN